MIGWALWPLRSRRFGIAVWAGALAAVIGLGYFGQRGIGQLERFLEGYNAQWLARFLRQRTDPMQSTTAIGQIGRLKLSGRIVIRLGPKTANRRRSICAKPAIAPIIPQSKPGMPAARGTISRTFRRNQPDDVDLLPGKTNTSSVNIACYLDGGKALLPLPTGSGRLENLNAYVLQKTATARCWPKGRDW